MPGAGQRLEPEDIEAARDAFAQSAVLLIQGEIPIQISAHAARLARSLGGRVMFNASPAPADTAAIPDALWSAVDVLLVNGAEAERLSGMSVADVPAAVMAGEALRRRFGIPTVIVTLGGRGAVALDERGTRHLPSWPVPVVETIGAGDAFAGVLASELARGRQLDEALPLANAAGSPRRDAPRRPRLPCRPARKSAPFSGSVRGDAAREMNSRPLVAAAGLPLVLTPGRR